MQELKTLISTELEGFFKSEINNRVTLYNMTALSSRITAVIDNYIMETQAKETKKAKEDAPHNKKT